MSIRNNYTHTICAGSIGYVVQAIINNFVPLLFLTFQSTYGINLDKIAMLITCNFGVQLAVDLLASKFADKVGYKTLITAAHIFAAAGLAGLAFLPDIMNYVGIVICVIIYAVGGGLIEVLVSPIIEACPTKRKSATMSLLHSFYCWGHVFVVLCSTLFFISFGIGNWRYLAIIWAAVPLINSVYFANVPINQLNEESESMSIKELAGVKFFWVLMLLMACAGASELAVSQWASAFAEKGLGVSKTAGDLAGPLSFAALMGIARVVYAKFSEKIHLEKFMLCCGVLCFIGYLMTSLAPSPVMGLIGCGLCGFASGILWPGTFSIAAREMKAGGTAMFGLLSLAGDLGCSLGPALVGFTAGRTGGNLQMGILAACIFPVILSAGLLICMKHRK